MKKTVLVLAFAVSVLIPLHIAADEVQAHQVTLVVDDGVNTPTVYDSLPWFAGESVFQAMVLGNSLSRGKLSFTASFKNPFGILIDAIGATSNVTEKKLAWFLYLDQDKGKRSDIGASEAILQNFQTYHSTVTWRYEGWDIK
jgi:hypothetical protein